MKHLYIVVILGCLLLSVSAGAEEIPVVQLDPEGNELFQPNWPEPAATTAAARAALLLARPVGGSECQVPVFS